jgi:hypothetical protein
MALTKTTNSLLSGAVINVLDYGAVSNGNFSGGSPSGTDNLTAFTNALAAAVSTGINSVYVPAGNYFLSGKITIPRGVTLSGVGPAHMPVWTSGSNRRGTVLLIAAATGSDCVEYDPSAAAGYVTLRNITIAHVGSTTNRSVVYIPNNLYPVMQNVELFSLVISQGVGLYLYGSTLWGNFDNVVANIQNPGLSNQYSFRYGLYVYGVNATAVANANSFRAGQFNGTWAGAYFGGATGNTGALSIVFHGTKFDFNWDGTAVPTFLPTGAGLFDYPAGPVYIVPVVHVTKGRNIAFHGSYIEAANEPTNYDDGVNGSYPLVPVFLNQDATYNSFTSVFDTNWNNTFPYDVASRALFDPTTNGYRHSARNVPVLTTRQATPQAIPNTTWTTIAFDTSLFGNTSHLAYDSGTNAVVCKTAGTYLISAQVGFSGWATSPTFAQIRITTTASGGVTFQGELKRELGATIVIVVQQSVIINLAVGQTVIVEAYHNQGGSQNTAANYSTLSVVQI